MKNELATGGIVWVSQLFIVGVTQNMLASCHLVLAQKSMQRSGRVHSRSLSFIKFSFFEKDFYCLLCSEFCVLFCCFFLSGGAQEEN